MRSLCALWLIVFASAVGCSDAPVVGNVCRLASQPDVDQVVIDSPSFDCESHLCLSAPPEAGAPVSEQSPMCTARCEVDDDCNVFGDTECESGFACAIPVQVGRFCCERMCVCRDGLNPEEDPSDVPAACDPSNAANTCCNLPGRDC